ncbi:ABC transporter permease subunit [Tissierella sp.]|uniref:ABC transporter permease n=1 Tax=Tissierella sp. TaxID=41274 RepID=UPI00285DFDA7|nr:ABC transporter permease subunit [Tissierella sp.]MDR7856494.1 ABC transporter permease subunit [Tissierella sp.]
MTGLIKNEIKLFFSRKNIILLILSCIIVILIFRTTYERQYHKYSQQRLQELSNEIDNAAVWSARYTRRLERLKEEFPGHIKTPEAELVDQAWKDHLRNLTTLSFLWKEPVENKEKIIRVEERLDENLIEVNKMQIETGDTRLYRDIERDWNKRMILLAKYKDSGLELDINPLKPTAMYLLDDSINGRSYISVLIIALVVLLNFDIWSKDFDNETLRLIFTLPFSKTKVFNTRFITRFILTLFLVTIPIIILCSFGFHKYGSGIYRFKIINSQALYTFGRFASDNEIMQAYDIVTSVSKLAIFSGFIFVLFLFFIYAIVNFVSYISKNQQISILLSMVGIVMLSAAFLVPMEVKNSAFNLIQFIDTNSLLTGALSFSWIWACSIFFITNLIIYFINLIWINYKE